MGERRYLCSELIFLEAEKTRTVVNLEEIWTTGAVIECETPPGTLDLGMRVRLRAGNRTFWASVTAAEQHEFGCRVAVEFSPMTPWKPEEYTPHHLFDPSSLRAGGPG